MIHVTMEGAEIRIRPVGRLDAEMMTTIAELLDSARTAGTEPVLDVRDLEPGDRVRVASARSGHAGVGGLRPVAGSSGTVDERSTARRRQ